MSKKALFSRIATSLWASIVFVTCCSQDTRVLNYGVLITSEEASVWLPLIKVPESKVNDGLITELASQLENVVFGNMQFENSERIDVICDSSASAKRVTFNVQNGSSGLELLTAIAINAQCIITVENRRITIAGLRK
jgi:hypothetical protein